FLRRRCLEAGGTGEHLGPGVRQNRDVGERGERGGRVGGDEDRRDSPARRSGESTADEWGAPGGGEPNDEVAGSRLARYRLASGGVILRALRGEGHRLRPAGQVGPDL